MKTDDEKIQKICEVLRKETLEPAQREAEALLEAAEKKCEQMILAAKEEAARIILKAQQETSKERAVFQTSMCQSAKQTIESLKHEIEHHLFEPEIETLIHQEMVKPETVAALIKAVVQAIEQEGLGADLEVIIPKTVPAKDVSALLGAGVFARLKNKELSLGNFSGGAKVRIGQKNMTIEVTDAALKSVIASYVKSDFRNYLFKNPE